jgi:hypothetical protein
MWQALQQWGGLAGMSDSIKIPGDTQKFYMFFFGSRYM